MRSFGRVAIVGALAASVIVSGALNARIADLELQRDIYQSRAANWERDALRWRAEAQVAEAQVADLKNYLEVTQLAPAGFRMAYLGKFKCTAYCSEQYEHICGTGDGITASGAPVQPGVTVAADPDILPLGSAVYIEGIGLRYVQDTGAAIKGRTLDVAVDTHENALTWAGYGMHKVWLLEGDDSE